MSEAAKKSSKATTTATTPKKKGSPTKKPARKWVKDPPGAEPTTAAKKSADPKPKSLKDPPQLSFSGAQAAARPPASKSPPETAVQLLQDPAMKDVSVDHLLKHKATTAATMEASNGSSNKMATQPAAIATNEETTTEECGGEHGNTSTCGSRSRSRSSRHAIAGH